MCCRAEADRKTESPDQGERYPDRGLPGSVAPVPEAAKAKPTDKDDRAIWPPPRALTRRETGRPRAALGADSLGCSRGRTDPRIALAWLEGPREVCRSR